MFYLLLRAAGSFATTHKRAPGSELAVGQSGPADRKADAELLRAMFRKNVQQHRPDLKLWEGEEEESSGGEAA